MPPVGFESTISAVKRLKTYALEREATGIGWPIINIVIYDIFINCNWVVTRWQ